VLNKVHRKTHCSDTVVFSEMMSFVVKALQGMTRWDSADTRRTDGFAVVEQHPDTSVHCLSCRA